MEQGQILSTAQKQMMYPKLYQQMELMAMPVFELRDKVLEELDTNPALVLKKTKKNKKSVTEIIEKTKHSVETLQEHLLFQLHIQTVTPEIIEIGELLIQNLDSNGFNIVPPEEVAKHKSPESIRKAIELINVLDPQGTCTENYMDSLIVQAKLKENAPPHTLDVLNHYFEKLERKKFKEIADQLKISESSVLNILEFIKTLNPFPGRNFSHESSQYIIPVLKITRENEEIAAYLLEADIPPIKISNSFIRQGEKSPELQKFVDEKVNQARDFINMLEMRNNNILKVANSIICFQKNFFLQGPKSLRALTLKEVAEDIGLSDSTISRITSKNYVQTDWGVFPFNYFFSSAVTKSENDKNSENLSKESVKSMILEIIRDNAKAGKLSDQKIADILNERGIKLARRTVAKYRTELEIASSYDR